MVLSDKYKKAKEILRNVSAEEEKEKMSSEVRHTPQKAQQTTWYKGSQPTETETLAQIYRLAQTDKQSAAKAFSLYQKAKSEGAWHNPYSQSTTQYGDLVGIDPSTLNDNNIKSLVPYLQNGVRTSSGSLSSAKKNGADAQYAYNLSILMQDYENTKAYLAEQDEIVREAQYWIRKGLNDDEIKAKLNIGGEGTKYTQIKNAIDKANVGEVVRTTSPLWAATSYGIDSMLWGLRNPDQTTGDKFYDAVQMELGRGNAYVRDEDRMSRLDATSDSYNPYVVGTTMDDLAIKFGVDQFDDVWLQQNRGMREDPKLAADYTKIYNAVQYTKLLQAEAEALKVDLKRYAEQGKQPNYESILAGDEYKNLSKLSESLKSGKLIDTTDVIDFDLQSLIAETDAAVKLKQNQTKAATDLEAATELAEEEKQGWLQKKLDGVANWWQNLTTPEETVAPPTPIIEETPAQIVSEGTDMFEPVVAQHIAEGDYNAAADEAMQEYAALLEQNPELLTTDDMQKGALFLLVAANEAGWLTDPAAQEKANSVMATVEASMGVDTNSTETKTVWAVLYNLLTGGDLSDAQNNEGIGANATLMLLWDRAMARGADLVDNVVGMAISGVGELLGNEWLINYGKETMAYGDTVVAHYDQYAAEHGTALENLVAKQGSELVHMAQLGGLSKAASAYKALKTGKLASFMTSVLMASPFAVEAGSSEMQDTYAETDDYSTSLAAGAAAFAVTSLLSQWDGILKNIEANGMPYLPEVVAALGSVPGSGAKAGIARWGKGFGMWMLNGLKTLANEGAQEAVEGGVTDIIVGLIKGENISDTDWAAFGQERLTDAVGGAFLSMGSAVSTMPTYARSVKVAESQMRKSDVTAKDVATFVSAMQADMQDPEIVKEMRERAQNIAVESRTGELIAEGAMPEVDASALESAQAKATEADAAVQVAEQKLSTAMERFNANPADDAGKNEVIRAASERAKAKKTADQAHAELASVQAETEAQQEAALNTVREQARAEVAQNIAATQAMRAEQEVAAEAKRQSDNVLALEADEFVERFYKNAPDDIKAKVREKYIGYQGNTQPVSDNMVRVAKQFKNKFGLEIEFIDSHGVFKGAYIGNGRIVLDQNATQGDLIRVTLSHEVVHSAKESTEWGLFSSAVLEVAYDGDIDKQNADFNKLKEKYSEETGQSSDDVIMEELVAKRFSEMMGKDPQSFERLAAEKPSVARRILDGIKEFINKLRGVNDPEIDSIRKIEKVLESALSTSSKPANDVRFQIVDRNGNAVTLSNSDIWNNMNEVANMVDVAVLEGNLSNFKTEFQEQAESETRFSLPSDDIINEEIEKYRSGIDSNWQGGQKESQFAVKTGQDTNVLTDEAKQKLLNDPFYTTTSEKKNLALAVDKIAKDGYQRRRDMMLQGDTNLLTPAGQIEAYVLCKLAKESGDSDAEASLAFMVKESGTQLAQSLAMRNIYNRMSPEAQLKYVQKAVNKINAAYEASGKDTRVAVPQWLSKALAEANGDAKLINQHLDDAYREIAKSMPYSFKDWESTWRYLAMLGNPLTHAKNVAATALYYPYVATRDALSAALQKRKPAEDRTRAFGPIKKEYKDFAEIVAHTKRDALTGTSMSTATNNALAKIEEYRQKGPKWMDAASGFNSNLLAKEDLFWKNIFFKKSLASYLQAQNADLNNLSPEMLNAAVQHALNDAYKNTFNNANQFAQWLSKVEKESAKMGAAGKVGAQAINTILPFKNTPANVLARGVDFSPVGLVKALTLDAKKLKDGKISSSEYFDRLTMGITGGVGAVGLGFLLASLGVLHIEEDELEDKQQNSIDILGQNIAIDWAGTAAMPILMGGKLYDSWQNTGKELFGDGFDLADIPDLLLMFGEAMRGVTDPMINLSVLQGVKNLVQAAGYAGDDMLSKLGTRVATTYASQFIPSFLGAVARIVDDTRRTTYTDKNSMVPADIQYFAQSIQNKIPFLSKTGMPYMDSWGNDESNGPVWRRLLNNLLLPGYSKSIESPDEVKKMLSDLYDVATGQGFSNANDAKLKEGSKYFTVNGQRYDMSSKEYVQYSKVRGQVAYDLLQELMQSEDFYNGSDYYKLKAVGNIWDYAETQARKSVNTDYVSSTKWLNTTNAPLADAMAKAAEADRDHVNDVLRANLYQAILDGNDDDIFSISLMLLDNGVTKKSLKTSISNNLQQRYKKLYNEGSDELLELEASLLMTGVITLGDISKWLIEE